MCVVRYIEYDDKANQFLDEDGSVFDASKVITLKDIIEYKRVGGVYYSSDNTYEIDFPIRDTNRILHYDSNLNMIVDEEGDTIYNIHAIVSPMMLSLFKTKKQTMVCYGTNGGLVELVYNGTEWDGTN